MSQNLKQLFLQMIQFFLFQQHQSFILKKVNKELNNIDNWLKHDKLSLNYNKTHYMLITKQKIPLDFDMKISINNNIISKVGNLKYLGVVLENKLTWNSHIA